MSFCVEMSNLRSVVGEALYRQAFTQAAGRFFCRFEQNKVRDCSHTPIGKSTRRVATTHDKDERSAER